MVTAVLFEMFDHSRLEPVRTPSIGAQPAFDPCLNAGRGRATSLRPLSRCREWRARERFTGVSCDVTCPGARVLLGLSRPTSANRGSALSTQTEIMAGRELWDRELLELLPCNVCNIKRAIGSA